MGMTCFSSTKLSRSSQASSSNAVTATGGVNSAASPDMGKGSKQERRPVGVWKRRRRLFHRTCRIRVKIGKWEGEFSGLILLAISNERRREAAADAGQVHEWHGLDGPRF